MSLFSFGKKSKGAGGSAGSSRDLESRTGKHEVPGASSLNGVSSTGADSKQKPGQGVDLTMRAPPALGTGGLDSRKGSVDITNPSRQANTGSTNANLYPWSFQELAFVSGSQNPFPRYGAAVNATASKEGDLYLMGGLVDGQTVKGDLWMIEAGSEKLSCYPVRTEQDGPGPRVGHAALLVGNAFIVFGGDTKQDENDELDDTLYLLNTSTKLWSRALPPGARPAGRYGHSLNILGSKLYVFGGQNDGSFFNDLVAFDLNQLQNSEYSWEILVPDSDEHDRLSPTVAPPARTNHTVITYNDKLYLFGGTDGIQWFNDVWTYDARTNRWAQLDCIGYIPAPREGHSAALVNDVMYIFGGRTQEGNDLGDLAAFRITSRRWYTFQNMGPSPSPRSGHSMTAHDKKIVVVAGEPSVSERDPEELSLVYTLDTTKIRYPTDSSSQSTPSSAERAAPGSRRPSAGASSIPRGGNGPQSPANPPPAGSRLPKPAGAAPAGPPPRGPPPRINGAAPGPAQGPAPGGAPGPVPGAFPTGQPGSRSGTPTRGYESSQNPSYAMAGDAQRGPQARSMSPALQARPPVTQQQPSKLANMIDDDHGAGQGARSRSQSQVPRPNLAVDPGAYAPQSTSQQKQQQAPHSAASAYSQESAGMEASANAANSSALALRAQDSATSVQLDAMRQEMEEIRKKAALYESELSLARKAGYTSNTGVAIPDERGLVDEKDKPLVEALILMKRELEDVQGSVSTRITEAAKRVAEAEQQRDSAMREAVYAKAKLAAHGGSQSGTPQLDDSTRDLDNDRSTEISRKLGTALTVQNDLRARLETITAQFDVEKRAREVAEQNAEAAQRRTAELEQSRNPGEIEGLRAELHDAQRTAREEAAQRTTHQTNAKMLEIERNELKTQLESVSASSTDHEASLSYLRSAMSASQEKTEMLEEKLQQERVDRQAALEKFQQLKAQHEERTAELDGVNRRLKDAEELAERNAQEASTHKNALMMGLKDRTNKRSDSNASSKAAEQRVIVLQQQCDDATELARKSQHEADVAAEKLRNAEERIAGLETFQQQSSRENLTIRKQLQDAMKEKAALQTRHDDVRRELDNNQRNASALSFQHGALKDLLDERSESAGGTRGMSGSPDPQRLREMEAQLEESVRVREEMRGDYEGRITEIEATYTEKLEVLEQDYQSAVSYVKGTEKMLKRMKDELTKSKQVNSRLEKELERIQRSGSRAGSAPPPADWDTERRRLQREIEEAQHEVKSSVTALEGQLASVQAERERAKQENSTLAMTVTQARTELDTLRADNARLEARAADAENKVSLLLDQVESSVDQYRRQSRASVNGAGMHAQSGGHARTVSSGSNYTAGVHGHGRSGSGGSESVFSQAGGAVAASSGGPTGDERGSIALDNLASELENLRTQWEGTHRSYRMSNSYNLGLDRIGAEGDLAGGGLSDSLANWRKRLDAEERSKTSSRSGSRTGDRPGAGAGVGGVTSAAVGGAGAAAGRAAAADGGAGEMQMI